MIGLTLYIQGQKVDLFDDENVELNSSVQNISDISKVFSDFSESFNVPASENNLKIIQHYQNNDVDGTFNPNIRLDAYLELGSLPFRYGTIQLEDVKIKNSSTDSINFRFYSKVVNLSDRFGEDELSILNFTAYDHNFDNDILEATYNESIANGDIYYPLISSVRNFEVGTANANDIITTGGKILFSDLKPALRLIRIIEAIELMYGFSFDRSFLGRASFFNLFMWLHVDAETIKVKSLPLDIDYTSKSLTSHDWGSSTADELDLTDNSVSVDWSTFPSGVSIYTKHIYIVLFCNDTTGYNYSVEVYDNGVLYNSFQNLAGNTTLEIYNKIQYNDNVNHNFTFKIISINGTLNIDTLISYTASYTDTGGFITFPKRNMQMLSSAQSTTYSPLSISSQMPKMKIKDFVTSIIKMFNLVLVPKNNTQFELLPLDDWYAKGKLIDITNYIDSQEVVIKRPKLFKRIDFKHQKSKQILNERFFENNGSLFGYGDLGTTYDIDGTELKVETQFENLMFERLQNRTTSDITNIQVGKSIDKNLKPYIGKPYIFYRNGYQFYDDAIKTSTTDLDYTWQTATENDTFLSQVSQSVNFSSDVSTFLFSEINTNLFSNYWSDYISDLYSTKRRLSNYKAILPISLIIKLKLNDRIVISDKSYIINSMRTNLTTGEVNFELLNYIGLPFTSVNDTLFLTADTIDYSADTESLTADMESFYIGQYSPIINGVERSLINCTPSAQKFDVKINANAPYSVIKVDLGNGVDWVNLENDTSFGSNYLLVDVEKYTSAITIPSIRAMQLLVTIGTDTFTINITQGQLI